MCTARADLTERCEGTWGMSYADLGWADRDEYLGWCQAIWVGSLDELDEDSDEYALLSAECNSDAQAAQSDVDCETLID